MLSVDGKTRLVFAHYLTTLPHRYDPQIASFRQTIRGLFRFQPVSLRTTLACLIPIFAGQAMNRPADGLMVGLGGLYVCLTANKAGANAVSLLVACGVIALATLAGTLAGGVAVLSIALLFAVAFVFGGMTTLIKPPVVAQIGFVGTMVFAVMLGLPGGLSAALPRTAELGLGGLWGTGLTLFLWRIASGSQPPPTENDQTQSISLEREPGLLGLLRSHLTLSSPTCQHALRLAFAAALAASVYKPLHLPHGSWLTVSVLVIVKPDHLETRKRAKQRVWGTIAGGFIAVLLAHVIHVPLVADVVLLGLSVLAFSHLSENYGMYVTFFTPFIVLLLHFAAPSEPLLAQARIIDTVLGGLLAFAIAFFLRVRPHEEREEKRETEQNKTGPR